jgi:hypothetical protein
MGVELTISGVGGVPQMRKVRRDGFTAEKRAIFLGELAQTMNVLQASRVAAVSSKSAYALRRRDPAFAEAWREALAEAYDKVEALLVQRAILGLSTEPTEAGEIGKLQGLSERGLLGLLGHHRQAVKEHREIQARAAAAQAASLGIGEARSARAWLEATLDEIEARLLAAGHGA